ncbi:MULTISPECIES: hypothetical protein [unclassified Bacillus (in: firmicutes)]|uniref:hypothetical protein n=1 Tax=unclassified Bacillus (in: firmicutes) TaxID=185979 RepID=UPI00232C4507|nr:hypothetical protein [Bacillus sp. BP-3]MDC2865516.1 hypothetical protein [Bacillus sp. BP-3]
MNNKKSIFLGAILSVLLSVMPVVDNSEGSTGAKVENSKINVEQPIFFSDDIIGGHH